MRKILVICGPTASGKTALAVECAKKLNSEVISADSMLIYRGCDIGSAKPTEEEKDGIIHHMIDIVDPDQEFSVSEYEEASLPILYRLLDEGKVPVVCGGTGFYIKSLLYKSQFGCSAKDDVLREKYERLTREKGVEYVHAILKEIDPESAEKLHPNDSKRVIRAIEIFELTGKKKSDQKDKEIPREDFLAVNIDYDRAMLYERINRRVDIMFQDGLVDEVVALKNRGITDENQCMQGIGYKEVYYGLNNGLSVDEIKAQIKQNTRNYAKRQITFFKRLQNSVFLPPATAKENAERIMELL